MTVPSASHAIQRMYASRVANSGNAYEEELPYPALYVRVTHHAMAEGGGHVERIAMLGRSGLAVTENA